MTAAASIYRSGFCGVNRHGACAGTYRGCVCNCDCHTGALAVPDLLDDLPEPEPEPPRHCPTCTCGGAA